jgi:cytoskeletal protein RodZ
METLGQKFKAARERKGVTPTQAAAATRIKVQHIESMERDDFSRMAAPAYAKGFIKIYADYLDLDSVPLIQEYMATCAPKEKQRLSADEPPSSYEQPAEMAETKETEAVPAKPGRMLPEIPWKKYSYVAAGALALIFAVVFLSRCGETARVEKAGKMPPTVVKKESLPVIREPPEPYMDNAAPSSGKKE